jgi:outer membrane protein
MDDSMKKIALVCTAMAAAVVSASSFAANSEGQRFAVSAGWMHIMPQGKAQGVKSTNALLGSVNDAQSGFEIKDADTGAILFDYLVNDNVSLELVAGVPPKMDVEGKGSIVQNRVNLEKVSTLADLKAYTPALLAKYQFGTASSKFRPFVGAGVMYAHFSDVKATNETNSYLKTAIGGQINSIEVKDAVAPVALLGADYNFNKNWYATASVSYAHLSTEATLNASSALGALQGKTKIEINPVVTYLGLGYRF